MREKSAGVILRGLKVAGRSDISLKRGNRQKRLLLPGTVPFVPQFLKMNRASAIDEIMGGVGQMTLMNRAGFNFDQRLVLAVDGVEMSGRMITVVEPNDDAVESADFRHGALRWRQRP